MYETHARTHAHTHTHTHTCMHEAYKILRERKNESEQEQRIEWKPNIWFAEMKNIYLKGYSVWFCAVRAHGQCNCKNWGTEGFVA